jgi:peptidoglycan/LPS O-acetylase OafA/YrhL
MAAILVLLHHVRVMLFPYFEEFPPELQNSFIRAYIFISGFNRASVLIFFTLSGFLIIRKVMQSLPNWTWREYLIDRLTRLWMVLLPSLLLSASMVWLGRTLWDGYSGGCGYLLRADQIDISLIAFLKNLFFLQTIFGQSYGDNLPLWSLAYEFWYYMLFPLVLLAMVARPRLRLLYLTLALVVIGCLWKLNADILALFPCWLAGGVAMIFEKRLRSFPSSYRRLLLGVGALQLAATVILHRVLRSDSLLVDYSLALSVAVFIVISIKCPTEGPGGIYHKLATFSSNCSYSVYLLHNSFLGMLFYLFFNGQKVMPTTPNLGLAALITLAAFVYCWVLYLIFEKQTPTIRKAAHLWLRPQSKPHTPHSLHGVLPSDRQNH